ncbi:PTS sugar transporter subunit IIC [Apilactobacillus sp. M161]|uniref:PTS sugar transporter subunit IIC n=1 Tax=Apilactobacillus xinyiensis TaxID=2841032 RepID=A0ABT0I107_9LACO|nr:PTS sugar transporter subunit IIC [Apilactobacillus xinyiensis]MCK8623952.1 PTS sugar transporter subunit IIC [Apilactobacillus xinyiensis]
MDQRIKSSKSRATAFSFNSSNFKEATYRIFAAVANAVLVVLGGGLLIQTIGNLSGIQALASVGAGAQTLLAPAIGVAVASQMKTNTLVTFAAMISATVGANAIHFTSASVTAVTATGQSSVSALGAPVMTTGQPISALLAAVVSVLVGKFLTDKTPLDMVLVPFTALFVGIGFGLILAAIMTPALLSVSASIAHMMQVSPVLGSIAIALLWSVFLMTPASSVALAVALTLDPLSSAAALIGTTIQFVAFTLISWRQNDLGANIAQGLVTPKVQFPNLLVNMWLWVPSLVATIICAPIATAFLGFKATYTLAGLGLNSLIAPIAYLSQGGSQLLIYVSFGIVIPAIISLLTYFSLKKVGLIKDNQLHLTLI